MRFPIFAIAGLSLALCGCVPATNTGGATAPSKAPSGPVGPGSSAVSTTSASAIFSQVCVDTAPSFSKAPAVLGSMPFRQHPSTGTYYHQSLDLSIKLMGERCSMVFGSRDDVKKVGIQMALAVAANNAMSIDPSSGAVSAKGPKGTVFALEPAGTFNGRGLYRAVLIGR